MDLSVLGCVKVKTISALEVADVLGWKSPGSTVSESHTFSQGPGNSQIRQPGDAQAILYIAVNSARWRRLPERFGHWHTICTRMRGWVRSGVLARVFEALQQEQIIRIKVEAASLDSTSVKVHPDGTGALKRTDRRASDDPAEDSRPGFIRLPQMLRSRELYKKRNEVETLFRRHKAFA